MGGMVVIDGLVFPLIIDAVGVGDLCVVVGDELAVEVDWPDGDGEGNS